MARREVWCSCPAMLGNAFYLYQEESGPLTAAEEEGKKMKKGKQERGINGN